MANNNVLYDPFGNPIPQPSQNTNQGQNVNQRLNTNQGPITVNSSFAWPNPHPQNPSYQYAAAPQQTQGQSQFQFQPQNQGQTQSQSQLPYGMIPQQGWLPPGLQPLGRTGLPSYFSDINDVHPHIDPSHPARGTFYYVNDGPRAQGEPQELYKVRVKTAAQRMNIEHRVRPLGPDTNLYQDGYQNPEWRALDKTYTYQCDQAQMDHAEKLKWGTVTYDPQYEANVTMFFLYSSSSLPLTNTLFGLPNDPLMNAS
jgi:hypothetical protein